MVGGNTRLWEALEKRRAVLFLAAGVAFLVAGAIDALGAYTALDAERGFVLFLEGIGGFGGVVLSYVGLVSLYPVVHERSPTMARAGVWLVAVPAVFFLVLLVWEVLAFTFGLFSLTATIPRLDVVTEVVFLLFALGVTLFGVVYLRDDALSRPIGGLLLLFAAAWVVFLAAIPTYGFPIPPAISLVHTVMTTVALLGIGTLLRIETDPTRGTDAAAETVAE